MATTYTIINDLKKIVKIGKYCLVLPKTIHVSSYDFIIITGRHVYHKTLIVITLNMKFYSNW